MYIRHFWQGNHRIYGHIRCIYTVLANPTYLLWKVQGMFRIMKCGVQGRFGNWIIIYGTWGAGWVCCCPVCMYGLLWVFSFHSVGSGQPYMFPWGMQGRFGIWIIIYENLGCRMSMLACCEYVYFIVLVLLCSLWGWLKISTNTARERRELALILQEREELAEILQ